MNPIAKRVNEMLEPTGLWPQAYVMGGGAICHPLAGDIDVWVFSENRDWRAAAEEVWANLPNGEWKTADTEPNSEYAEMSGMTSEGDFLQLDIRLLGTFASREASISPIQILSVCGTPPETILESFDISTHKWGVHLASDTIMQGLGATLPLQMPRVLRWNTPQRTAERLLRICKRFGFPINQHPDVPKLQSLYMPAPSTVLDKAS